MKNDLSQNPESSLENSTNYLKQTAGFLFRNWELLCTSLQTQDSLHARQNNQALAPQQELQHRRCWLAWPQVKIHIYVLSEGTMAVVVARNLTVKAILFCFGSRCKAMATNGFAKGFASNKQSP